MSRLKKGDSGARAELIMTLRRHSFVFLINDSDTHNLEDSIAVVSSYMECIKPGISLRHGIDILKHKEKLHVHLQKTRSGWLTEADVIATGGECPSTAEFLSSINSTWAQMEEVGLLCLDVLCPSIGMGGATELVTKYCDPSPLPDGALSSSCFDVFLYFNTHQSATNCPSHYDPGFFTLIKDNGVPGLEVCAHRFSI